MREDSSQVEKVQGNSSNKADTPASTQQKACAGEKSEFDFSCFEETEDDALDQELDPATFRQFVEDAAERMSSSGSLAGLTSSTSAHSLENAADAMQSCDGARERPLPLPAHTRLEYNPLVGQDAWLVISVAPPFHILAASPAWTELFGFREQELVGRSLRMVQGPQTNARELGRGIAAAVESKAPLQAVFVFYTKRSEARVLTVDISPEMEEKEDEGGMEGGGGGGAGGEGGAVTHAVLTMDHADWVPKKIAYAEDERAKAVILADRPHSVVSISQHFSALYQMEDAMIVGRTLRAIFGPMTNEAAFRKVLVRAKTGRTQNLCLWTCRADASQVHVRMTLFPVMEEGSISHVMIVVRDCDPLPDDANLTFTRRDSGAWLAGARDPGSPTELSADRSLADAPVGYSRERKGVPGVDLDGDEAIAGSPVAGAKPEEEGPYQKPRRSWGS